MTPAEFVQQAAAELAPMVRGAVQTNGDRTKARVWGNLDLSLCFGIWHHGTYVSWAVWRDGYSVETWECGQAADVSPAETAAYVRELAEDIDRPPRRCGQCGTMHRRRFSVCVHCERDTYRPQGLWCDEHGPLSAPESCVGCRGAA